MPTRAHPSRPAHAPASPDELRWPVLAVCLALSVLVHLPAASGIGAYFSARGVRVTDAAPRARALDLTPMPAQEDPELRLGRAEAKRASITWLGVLERPVEGDAPESTVEQAELAIEQGQRTDAGSMPAPPRVNELLTQVQPEQQPEPQPEPSGQPQSEPVAATEPPASPQQTTLIEPKPEERNDPEVPAVDAPQTASRTAPEIATEVAPESQPEASSEARVQEEAQRQAEPKTDASPQPASSSGASSATPGVRGKPGEADDRESVASMIKRADTKRVSELNRPLSSAGLEIKPVEPRYPASVRFTQLPRNPIVLIRFNASGRVVYADFLRDEEKHRVYDTGSRAVDEPLISAIYKWRATGEPLKKLDPDDPSSYIEIPMKILFRGTD